MGDPVVAVALSGGIDSLVAACLLKKKYSEIFGIHFLTGYEPVRTDVAALEQQLGFPVHCIDLSEMFEKQVVQYFIRTYMEGKTPNPCIICNRTIKFGYLMDQALKMGADLVATGHYARIGHSQDAQGSSLEDQVWLEKGMDSRKDQSYFLSFLPNSRLSKIVFPLGEMTKKQVREYAGEKGIHPLTDSESQDICFIRDGNFPGFILKKSKHPPMPGDIVDPKGRLIGRHDGLHRFTVGQRRGINCPAPEPYYVKQIDMANNRLVVCFKKDLSASSFDVHAICWNDEGRPPIPDMQVKIRYSHRETPARLEIDKNTNTGKVFFREPQNAVTPGQAAVFYLGNRVLGAGIIQ